MNLKAVRTTPEGELPWTKNSIYKYSAQGRYPEILIKFDGKLFIDMDAFIDSARKKRDAQIRKAKNVRKGIEV